jgi:hypothetical protein
MKGIATLLSRYLQYIRFMTSINELVSKDVPVECGNPSTVLCLAKTMTYISIGFCRHHFKV